jgi:hypothetical protein
MNRIAILPPLLFIASVLPLVALAQTNAGADTGITVDATSATLPQTASSAAADVPSDDDDLAFQQQDAAERKRIADGRAAAYARYEQGRYACWQRFAVNACLDRARAQRRATLDALRHDELTLNAQERQRRTAARLDEIAHKQAESAARDSSAPMPVLPASEAQ